jgi:hypothetical protein
MNIPGSDSTWVWSTWVSYIKPKYSKALINWNKRTGNGSVLSEEFQKYACFKWLVGIYLKDEESGFLHSASSNPYIPRRLSFEAWFTLPTGSNKDVTANENVDDNDNETSDKNRVKKVTKAD